MRSLNAIAGQVAAAAEEQAVTTQEIGRAVAEATTELSGASSDLARQAEALRGKVDGFLAEIRAARP